MGNQEARMNEIAIHEARSATDNLGRVVDSLATTTAKGLQTLNKRIKNDKHYVKQMQLATVQGFRYVNDRTTHVENHQSQLETELRHLKLQIAGAVVIALLLWRFPQILAEAVAFCKQVVRLPIAMPLNAPVDAPLLHQYLLLQVVRKGHRLQPQQQALSPRS